MYELNEKLRALSAYVPVDASGCVRLDANESFLGLPEEVITAAKAAIERIEFNRYPDPAAAPFFHRICILAENMKKSITKSTPLWKGVSWVMPELAN